MWRCPLRAPSPVGNSGSRVGNGVETQGPRILETQGGSPSLFPGWWQVRAHPEKVTFKVDLGESTRGRGTDLGGKGLIVKQRNLYLPPWAFEGSKVGEITRNYWKCFGNVLILNFFLEGERGYWFSSQCCSFSSLKFLLTKTKKKYNWLVVAYVLRTVACPVLQIQLRTLISSFSYLENCSCTSANSWVYLPDRVLCGS